MVWGKAGGCIMHVYVLQLGWGQKCAPSQEEAGRGSTGVGAVCMAPGLHCPHTAHAHRVVKFTSREATPCP